MDINIHYTSKQQDSLLELVTDLQLHCLIVLLGTFSQAFIIDYGSETV
ncbi:4550_t:CDS:2 [Acaulospora colombiana]|uniref:4550_t:CDS:1 n=1 Tax=Acaulospora colombiana TaxID=27376 RepID=A0ACA9K6T3_9GLOM|nr:4550_t:CDS:2 [Acaulospora colombiana]